jgi:hypothetical protein
MFFVRIGTVLAWLGLVLGVARMAMGFFVANAGDAETRAAVAARYLGSISPGEAIDRGALYIVFAIALGILAKIGRSVSERR